jgi:hypothetical protein
MSNSGSATTGGGVITFSVARSAVNSAGKSNGSGNSSAFMGGGGSPWAAAGVEPSTGESFMGFSGDGASARGWDRCSKACVPDAGGSAPSSWAASSADANPLPCICSARSSH